jgi:hypothetical protein
MRNVPTMSLALVASLALADAAVAGPPTIERVRIGLPAGKGAQESGRSRNGFWAPVAITIKAGAEGHPQGAYHLTVEATDAEEATYRYTVPVPAMAAEAERPVTGYVVPGTDGGEFAVRLVVAESGKVVDSRTRLTRDLSKDEVLTPGDVLFLGAGAGLSQLKRAAEKLDKPQGKDDDDKARRQFVFAEEVSSLPDRWFGYDAVDVVVLATGKAEFVTALAGDAARRNALLEWVRRGGQVVLSVGRNKQEVAGLLKAMPLLPVEVAGSGVVDSLPELSGGWVDLRNKPALGQVEVAEVKPGAGVHVTVRDAYEGWWCRVVSPVLLEGSCGLGRVVLVAFDLDTPPFTVWEGQQEFWQRLQKDLVPYSTVRQPGRPMAVRPGMPGQPPVAVFGGEDNFELRGALKRGLEKFDELPTIPFGWVALFVLFYIALVGPLDYFVLKKVFKRLELTWITFPLTVVVVSVAAYFTAYALKGDDLRINKIDLVDVDLHGPSQVYGRSWFTLFSPRVQGYTVGLEPAGGWTAPVPKGAPGPLFTLLEAGDRDSRGGSQGLFPRPYDYVEDGTGLRRVPVPVWSTRTFAATWRAPLAADRPAIDHRDDRGPLRRGRTDDVLVGRITNNLPVELRGCSLFYRDRWYDLGTLAPGEAKRVEPLFARDARGQGRSLSEWFSSLQLAPGLVEAPSGRPLNANFKDTPSAGYLMKETLFHQADLAHRGNQGGGQGLANSGLRTLDQSWRLRRLLEFPTPPPGAGTRYRDEAILVARTPMLSDHAETVTEHGASPARLWLGALPGEGDRPSLPGFITQETYVRVFIPIQAPDNR